MGRTALEIHPGHLTKWGLPGLPNATVKVALSLASAISANQAVAVARTFAGTPMPEQRSEDITWAGLRNHFQLVVDCKILADLICGRSPLLNDELQPVFTRASRSLASILDTAWLPKESWADLVQWRL